MYNNQKGKEEDSPTLNVALFRAMEYCEDESQKHQLQKPDTKDYIYVMQFLGNSRKHESISPKKKVNGCLEMRWEQGLTAKGQEEIFPGEMEGWL